MRIRALVGLIVIALLVGAYFWMNPGTETSAGQKSFLKPLQSIFSGFMATSSTSTGPLEASQDGSETIFDNINDWFSGVTGIGLDQVLLAMFKLLLWIFRAIFNLIWNFANSIFGLVR